MENDINSLYQYTFDLLIKKKRPIEDVIKLLVIEKNITEDEAFDIIQDIFSYTKKKEKKQAQKNIRIGAIIFLFSILMGLALFVFPTIRITYRYLGVMIMLFLIGGVQFINGLIRFAENKTLDMDNYIMNEEVNRDIYNRLEENAVEHSMSNESQLHKDEWEDIARCQNNIIYPPHGSNEYYCPQCENEAIWIYYKGVEANNDCHMAICPTCKLVLNSQLTKL
ncbi:MAG: hypothetical protein LBV43_11965 [Prevotella sp.]|jgi:hypothetical protein|nr:hypothetical protein [Prevotella sp.]